MQDHTYRLRGTQDHAGSTNSDWFGIAYDVSAMGYVTKSEDASLIKTGRKGDTTHSKQIGVSYIIRVQ